MSFVTNGQGQAPPVRAHRALAARLLVLKAELYGHMLEANAPSAPITVSDMNPDTFKPMLRFIYTDRLPTVLDGDEAIRSLLAAADRYGLDRLKLLCAKRLLDKMSVSTITGLLDCAKTYNCPELKTKRIDYAVDDKSFKRVALTDGFRELMDTSPSILSEIRDRLEHITL